MRRPGAECGLKGLVNQGDFVCGMQRPGAECGLKELVNQGDFVCGMQRPGAEYGHQELVSQGDFALCCTGRHVGPHGSMTNSKGIGTGMFTRRANQGNKDRKRSSGAVHVRTTKSLRALGHLYTGRPQPRFRAHDLSHLESP